MNKKLAAFSIALLASLTANADITVKFGDQKPAEQSLDVSHMLIADQVKPRAQRPQPATEKIMITDGLMKFEADPNGPAQYMIPVIDRQAISFFTEPGNNLVIDVTSISPLEYTVKGSQLMEDITMLDEKEYQLTEKYKTLTATEPIDEAAVEDISRQYEDLFINFIKENPGKPASLYALLNLDGETFIEQFNALPAGMTSSPLYPLVAAQKDYVEKSIEADKKRSALENIEAPQITLKNLEGKEVSLSDFRGKWVVIDFWGSWCGWCIKGFPKLKEAYAQYAGKMEVFGVDCNDSEEAWRAAVKKYELPWVNVYNPAATAQTILDAYGVTGFPTKIIVSPEGKIANVTVGEDPNFFTILAKLIAGK